MERRQRRPDTQGGPHSVEQDPQLLAPQIAVEALLAAGDLDEATEALTEAVSRGFENSKLLLEDPDLDPLRGRH